MIEDEAQNSLQATYVCLMTALILEIALLVTFLEQYTHSHWLVYINTLPLQC